MKTIKEKRDSFEPVQQRKGNVKAGEKPLFYYLYRDVMDGSFWETRPLYDRDDMYYSGGPVEYVQVDREYIQERYDDVV
jgi:hypothetical protein